MPLKLTQLAAKPQLIRIELDDEDIRKEFGDSLEFWIWDRQPIEKFIKVATTHGEDLGELIRMVNDMIMDEEGNPVIKGEEALPHHVMMKAIAKVVETLGK